MKSKFNPSQYMLLAYKGYMGVLYEKSFKETGTKINHVKLHAFCLSLVKLMQYKGYNYSFRLSEKGYDIFHDNTLIITYNTSIVENIKQESSLKFQLFIEWGLLMKLTKKEQALIAL